MPVVFTRIITLKLWLFLTLHERLINTFQMLHLFVCIFVKENALKDSAEIRKGTMSSEHHGVVKVGRGENWMHGIPWVCKFAARQLVFYCRLLPSFFLLHKSLRHENCSGSQSEEPSTINTVSHSPPAPLIHAAIKIAQNRLVWIMSL